MSVDPRSERALIRRGLRQCKMLQDWPPEVVDRLARHSLLKNHPRRTQLAMQDLDRRDVLVTVTGSIEVSGLNASGQKFVLSVLGPGGLVGLVNLLDVQDLAYAYVVREDALIVHVPTALLRTVLDENPLLWRDVALITLQRQMGNIQLMERRALAPIPQLLGQVLVRLVHWSGRPNERQEIELDVSQADLASMVSVSRQTVNRELGKLARAGIVSASYGHLTIHDLDAVMRLAARGPGRSEG